MSKIEHFRDNKVEQKAVSRRLIFRHLSCSVCNFTIYEVYFFGRYHFCNRITFITYHCPRNIALQCTGSIANISRTIYCSVYIYGFQIFRIRSPEFHHQDSLLNWPVTFKSPEPFNSALTLFPGYLQIQIWRSKLITTSAISPFTADREP